MRRVLAGLLALCSCSLAQTGHAEIDRILAALPSDTETVMVISRPVTFDVPSEDGEAEDENVPYATLLEVATHEIYFLPFLRLAQDLPDSEPAKDLLDTEQGPETLQFALLVARKFGRGPGRLLGVSNSFQACAVLGFTVSAEIDKSDRTGELLPGILLLCNNPDFFTQLQTGYAHATKSMGWTGKVSEAPFWAARRVQSPVRETDDPDVRDVLVEVDSALRATWFSPADRDPWVNFLAGEAEQGNASVASSTRLQEGVWQFSVSWPGGVIPLLGLLETLGFEITI